MDAITEKFCKDCKYFYQHYGLGRGKIQPLNCGHCLKRNMSKNNIKIFPCQNGCDMWEENSEVTAKREEDLLNSLKKTIKKLNELVTILETVKTNETPD